MNDKKIRILKAATSLFSKYGPKKTTIDDIANEAKIAKGTVYIYFKSKEDIFLAVVRQEIDHLLANLRKAIRNEKNATEKLRTFLLTRFGYREDAKNRHNTTFEIMDESNKFMDLTEPTQKFVEGEVQIIKEIIETGIEAGEFKKRSDLAHVISFSMLGMDTPWNIGPNGRPLKTSEKADLFLSLILDGLKA